MHSLHVYYSALVLTTFGMVGCGTTLTEVGDVDLRFVGHADNGHRELLFFELTNATNEPAWFIGFDLNVPLYEIHRSIEDGSEQVDSAFSATGAKPQALGPGQQTVFVFPRHFQDEGDFWLEIGVSTLSSPQERWIKSDTFSLSQPVDR